MEQELPLTPAITDYARAISLRKGNVAGQVIFVLIFCSTLPAFLSFVWFFQHRFVGSVIAVIWVVSVGLGGGMLYLGLRFAGLVSRDLAGGVYVRWTGPFTTRVVRDGRYSKALVVEAGGRKLGGALPLRLLPIGLNSGTIDYLPASRSMFEVRNEQGSVVWTRLVTTGDSPVPASLPPE
jgi:hypothetical protein